MVEYLFKNEAIGTLDTAIGTGDTTLFLETGDGANFPSISGSQVFRALIFDEALHVGFIRFSQRVEGPRPTTRQ